MISMTLQLSISWELKPQNGGGVASVGARLMPSHRPGTDSDHMLEKNVSQQEAPAHAPW